MSESLNRDQFEQLVRAIADGRRKPEDEVRALIDQGPFLPEEALRVGLVDELAYEDELDDVDDVTDRADDRDGATTSASRGSRSVCTRRSRVAVINAVGTIVSGESGFDPVNGAVLGSDSLVEHIRQARDKRREGHRRAHRQPRRIVGGVRRDLARADDHEGREAARRRVDVRPGGVGRLLHRHGGRRHRRAARHADRIDRRLHRQVRHRRHVRQAGRQHRGRQPGEARRHVLARPPLHGRGARQGAGVHAGHLRPVRRAGGRVAAHDAREDRPGRAGARVDGPAGARDRAWWTSSAG